MTDYLYLLLLIPYGIVLKVVFEYFSPTDDEIGYCPDGSPHQWISEYGYYPYGGDYTKTSCGKCGA